MEKIIIVVDKEGRVAEVVTATGAAIAIVAYQTDEGDPVHETERGFLDGAQMRVSTRVVAPGERGAKLFKALGLDETGGYAAAAEPLSPDDLGLREKGCYWPALGRESV